MLCSSYTWSRSCKFLVFSRSLPCVETRSGLRVHRMYTTVERGSLYTEDYRLYFKNDAGPISPMHDIPLYADYSKKLYNMVVEIPRWTNAKMEINIKEPLNPIKQDVKKGKVRFVSNCFPHHGYIWNYGALPQTWENPSHVEESTGCKGDNDPVDIIEIGSKIARRGEVLRVKILGCIALIDEGETDWKIVSLDHEDPLAGQINDMNDVENFFPGLMKATMEWFKVYKIPDGKPENKFAFNGEAKGRDFAITVVDRVHCFWKTLIQNEAPRGEICCTNLTVDGNPHKMSVSEANEIIMNTPDRRPPAAIDPSVNKWYFIKFQKE